MKDLSETEQNMQIVQKNKKTVIIGASGGIGRKLALELSSSCSELVLHGISQEKLDSLKDEIHNKLSENSSDKTKFPKITDISYKFTPSFFTDEDDDSAECVKNQLLEHIKTADTLCICYGPFLQKPLHLTTKSEWLESSSLVFALPGFFVSQVLPHMMEQKFGRILLFGGTRTDSVNGYKTNAVYGAGKTAVCSLVKSVCLEYSQYGISCNAILPGFVETEYVSESQMNYYKNLLNSDGIIESKSVAKTAKFLLDNEDVNGMLFRIDRGWNC